MATPQRSATDALKKVEKLSDQLDTARDASEVTTKEVQHARHTVATILKRAKGRVAMNGKSQAAVELGRKGGVARAKALTRHQRSALAMKAAKSRWKRP